MWAGVIRSHFIAHAFRMPTEASRRVHPQEERRLYVPDQVFIDTQLGLDVVVGGREKTGCGLTGEQGSAVPPSYCLRLVPLAANLKL